jgi:hypothetical protein
MSRRRSMAALGLAVLLGGLSVPLLGLFPADGPIPSCCRGRCCCTGEATDDGDGRPCLRQRCGCGQPGTVAIAAPLQVEAILPAAGLLVAAPPSEARGETAGERPLPRADAPPVPPPRRPLPA